MAKNLVTRDLVRGMTSWAVLRCLQKQAAHGYELMNQLHTHGLPQLKSGTVYPLLHRLEQAGLVTAEWDHSQPGPGRRIFHLSEAGSQELGEAETQLGRIIQQIKGDGND